ncbi:hypothetical protein ASE33_25475 [Pseudomonas sp. Root9]|uniref:Uncharacterized protein n=1 Tax=Pseudomonas fluorescens TaxID=294 RepID=A0A125QE89_PSEFL|nr:hypothetical protein ASE33_25475 [Pseudomonas sp. Root9]KWV74319.1 hypothetical protein PFL603g_03233 [Pseudomonas fluorescens]
MSRTHIGLKQARPTNKRILLSASALFIVGLSFRLIHDNALFHAQKYRHFMGFSTSSFFSPGEHLIGGCRIYAMLPGERLN